MKIKAMTAISTPKVGCVPNETYDSETVGLSDDDCVRMAEKGYLEILSGKPPTKKAPTKKKRK